MKILLAGPMETGALGAATGINLAGLPAGTAHTPLAPLAAGLLAAGHKVHIATLDPTVEETRHYRHGDLCISFCPLRGAPRYRARVRSRDLFAREIAYLAHVMREADADIVHAHWTYEYADAALRSGRPALITMHDLGWEYLFRLRDLYRGIRLMMKYRVMIRARRLSAVSPFVANKAWQYGHFGKVAVVPNPIEAAPAPAKSLDRPVIVTVGNDARLKNVAAAIAAFQRIRAQLPAAELHLFGPGLGHDGRFASAGPGVMCHGNVRHGVLMRFLEQEARLLIHPSRMETFGVILAEAKMRGVPVIAGLQAGGAGFAINGKGGVLVDIESPQAIAAAALDMLTDGAAYAGLQAAAHRDAVERFSVRQITDDYVALYRRIHG